MKLILPIVAILGLTVFFACGDKEEVANETAEENQEETEQSEQAESEAVPE